eukprot:TRINITY_DN7189_c0_g2_i1.p1 TRINITY_DN7189_c0_g2~~TRINITY_DN7189_c0_g2_i1.p1  ORF type:complete len:543 (+),score=71.68 TRINITY_DN7189_c0_g2_i1:71-1699(+)
MVEIQLPSITIETRQAIAPFVAEFLGTFFIALCHASAVAGDEAGLWWPCAVGFVAMGSIYGAFAVSGGHLNPAVSLAFYMSGKLNTWNCLGFVAIQICAGLFSGVVTLVMQEGSQLWSGTVHSSVRAIAIEGIYCIAILIVTLACYDLDVGPTKRRRNQYFGLAVGFTIGGGGYVAAGSSLSMFNPAVTISSVVLGRTTVAFGTLCALTQLAVAFPASLLVGMFRDSVAAEQNDSVSSSAGRYSSASSSSVMLHVPVEHTGGEKLSLTARLTAELFGTFLCVLTFMLCMESTNGDVGEDRKADVATLLAHNATSTLGKMSAAPRAAGTSSWATGFVAIGMVCSFRSVSGAHLNPAVTLAVACGTRNLTALEAWSYAAVQSIAGMVAGLVCIFFRAGGSKAGGLFGDAQEPLPKAGVNWWAAGFGEMLFTMTLALVVMCVTCVTSPRYRNALHMRSFDFGIAVGMCVSSGSIALQNYSGGLLNPAILIGSCAECYLSSKTSLTVLTSAFCRFLTFQLAGGLLAALTFVALHPLQYKPDPLLRQ